MLTSRRMLFAFSLMWGCLVAPNQSFAEINLPECSIKGGKVITAVDDSLSTVAEARMTNGEFVILVNPFKYDVTRDTIQWLYYRQCWMLREYSQKLTAGLLGVDQHEYADCAALREMRDRKLTRSYTVKAINRDIDRLRSEKSTHILGPNRFIDLTTCN